tara:strand:- start:5979 stop:6605 length:627 start_codon:yes stop_codon:yes gene_type:complete
MNFTQLETNIKNFLEDDGAEFNTSIPEIIKQAESMIFARLPNLPCYRKELTGNFVIGTKEYDVANARMIRQVAVTKANNDVIFLKHRIDSYLRDFIPNATTQGEPFMYATKKATTSGIKILIGPVPSATLAFEVDFIGLETGLSSTNANSWIGDNAEQVLLSACLYESSAFLKAPDSVNLYKAQFDEAIALFQQEMQRNYQSEYEGGI